MLRDLGLVVDGETPEAPTALTAPTTPTATASPPETDPADPLEALCWAVVRPVCNSMRGCERKRAPTIAAFVNTLMAPQLFVDQVGGRGGCGNSARYGCGKGKGGRYSHSDHHWMSCACYRSTTAMALLPPPPQGILTSPLTPASFLRLHSPSPETTTTSPGGEGATPGAVLPRQAPTPQGPLHWALGRILEWGAASPRVALMAACQLSALLDLNPALLPCYTGHVRALLLFSSGGRGEGKGFIMGGKVGVKWPAGRMLPCSFLALF